MRRGIVEAVRAHCYCCTTPEQIERVARWVLAAAVGALEWERINFLRRPLEMDNRTDPAGFYAERRSELLAALTGEPASGAGDQREIP